MRRLLVAACAALALALACVTGELRGGAVDDDGSDSNVVSAADTIEALPPVAGMELSPPSPSGGVFVDLSFPPSRLATADVFRPPRA
jgi:hypothetical protein